MTGLVRWLLILAPVTVQHLETLMTLSLAKKNMLKYALLMTLSLSVFVR